MDSWTLQQQHLQIHLLAPQITFLGVVEMLWEYRVLAGFLMMLGLGIVHYLLLMLGRYIEIHLADISNL